MNILIIRLSALGDILHMLWIMRQLRADFVNARISLLCDERFAPLFEDLAYFDEVLKLRKKHWKKDAKAHAARGKFDYSLDFQGRIKSALCGKILANKRFGYSARGCKAALASLFYDERADCRYDENVFLKSKFLYEFFAEKVLKNYSPGGLIKMGDFFEFKNPVKLPENLVIKKKFFLLHNGASKLEKALKIEQLCEFAKFLEQKFGQNFCLFLSWGNLAEKSRAEIIANSCSAGFCEVLPKLNLLQLAELSKHAQIIIGHDSGPLYIGLLSGSRTLCFVKEKRKKPLARVAPLGGGKSGKNIAKKLSEFDAKTAATLCEKILEQE